MQLLSKTTQGFWLMVVLMLALIFYRHTDLVLAPNSYFIDESFDGYKNYVTTIYHVKYDSTYSHFEGMNYPYGDHVVFTDNQPILANTIKFISENIVDISDYTHGIMNVCILLSILFCGLLLYLIFVRLDLPIWYAILIAIGICWLSPQMGRIKAHYALSYGFVVPLVLYLTLLFEEKKSWVLSIAIGLTVFIVSQLHFYFFAITSFLIALYTFFRLLSDFTIERFKFYVGHMTVQLLIPFLLLANWLIFNDPVTDRPSNPYGFLKYNAKWEGVFIPNDFHTGRIIKNYIYDYPPITSEGKAFIGIIAVLFLLFGILNYIFSGTKRKVFTFQEEHRGYLQAVLGASIVILCFALGLPFAFPNCEFLLDYAGPLKQFRGTGRFAWVFYYCINILVFYSLYQRIRMWATPKWRMLAMFALGAITIVEGITFTNKQKYVLKPPADVKGEKKKHQNWMKAINFDDYQAVLPLPYYHIGSENFYIHPKWMSMHRSMELSLQTALPNMADFMSRTSLSQSIKSIELTLEPYRIPKILDDLPNDKPILIWVDELMMEHHCWEYEHLLINTDIVYDDKTNYRFYKLSPDDFRERVIVAKVAAYESFDKQELYPQAEFFTRDSINNIVYHNFNDRQSKKSYQGSGCLEIPTEGGTLFKGSLPHQHPTTYAFSFWTTIDEDLYPQMLLHYQEKDLNADTLLQSRDMAVVTDGLTVLENGWALLEILVEVEQSDSELLFTLDQPALKGKTLYVDEMLIREADNIVFKKTENGLMHNNRWWLD